MILKCFKCGRNEDEVKLLDAITFNQITKICEECSLLEDIPVIRRPSTFQLKSSEEGNKNVHVRLERISETDSNKSKISKIAHEITQKNISVFEEKKDDFERKSILAKSKNKPLHLIDNFNWHILMARKKKKLSRNQLAEFLGESETAIKMIENKEFPDDAPKLINKLEQFFGIKLKKQEIIEKQKETPNKPAFSSWGKTQEFFEHETPEKNLESPEIKNSIFKKSSFNLQQEEPKQEPLINGQDIKKDLIVNKKSIKNLTIGDLKKLQGLKEDNNKTKIENSGKSLFDLIWKRGKEIREKKQAEKEEEMLGDEIEMTEDG
ncbi:MAG: helix-turn-helix transcriptional regulator [Nanoarchaeota archaeon]|nr:helix-turn-helix transcriptional regulator [Nanoarchaeota archaeon]